MLQRAHLPARTVRGSTRAFRPMASASHTQQVSVHVWSDIACPWCWVGKKRFDKAVDVIKTKRGIDVEVNWWVPCILSTG